MPDSNDYLTLLKSNGSFLEPEKWVQFAKTHQFKNVKGLKIELCPDCGSTSGNLLGQYIYYSNLISLVRCASCDLIYSNLHLPHDLIVKHFQDSYKDEEYFVSQRAPIFEQIAELVKMKAGKNASILDIGGAKGHLLQEIRKLRPDCSLLLNDLSESSCSYASQNFNLEAVAGPAFELEKLGRKFNFILLIDVLYYEANLHGMWNLLERLLEKDGSILLRFPNHLPIINFWSFFSKNFSSKKSLPTRIPLFNPEHIYVFSRRYINAKLKLLGCTEIEWISSRVLGEQEAARPLRSKIYKLASQISKLPGTPVLSPSTFVMGTKRN